MVKSTVIFITLFWVAERFLALFPKRRLLAKRNLIKKPNLMKTSVLFFFLVCMFISCNDQIETKFGSYKKAQESDFFEKGWIPNNLIYESMTNIYLQNNIDLNSAFFSYNLSSLDIDNLKTKIHKNRC